MKMTIKMKKGTERKVGTNVRSIVLLTLFLMLQSFSPIYGREKIGHKKQTRLAVAKTQLKADANRNNRKIEKIVRKMLILKPGMNTSVARKYATSFNRYARRYQLSSNLLLAIAYQESGFEMKSMRKERGVIVDEYGEFKEVEVGFDFCLMQVSYWNVRKRSLDLNKMMKNTDKCIGTGAKILSEFKELYGDKEEFWWTRYNANTPRYRDEYRAKVERHLVKIQGI